MLPLKLKHICHMQLLHMFVNILTLEKFSENIYLVDHLNSQWRC